MRWKTLTSRCSKFIQETMCQISAQLREFCRRYYRKHFGLFFFQTRCRFVLNSFLRHWTISVEKTSIPQLGSFPQQNNKFHGLAQNSASRRKLWSLMIMFVIWWHITHYNDICRSINWDALTPSLPPYLLQ